MLVFIQHWTSIRPLALEPGHLGVQLFFVLSGFLITRILLRTRAEMDAGRQTTGAALKNFYIRRCLRIFPLYYSVVFALAAAGAFQVRETLFWHLSYLVNFYVYEHGWIGRTSHFWTLAVEEQFYVLWPFLVLLLPRRALLPTVVAFIIAAPVWRVLMAGLGAVTPTAFTLLIANVDTLAIGALLALAEGHTRWSSALSSRRLPVCVLVAAAAYVGLHVFSHESDDFVLLRALLQTALGLVFALVIWWVATRPGPLTHRLLNWGPLAYGGKISYGLYVFHDPMRAIVRRVAEATGVASIADPGFVRFLVLFIATSIVAVVSWEVFEKRANGLKVRYQ